MGIDEAIELIKQRRKCKNLNHSCFGISCEECECNYDNKKLEKLFEEYFVNWLEELKAMRNLDKTNFSDGYAKGRAEVIDDVMNLDRYKFGATMLTAEEYIKISDIKQLKDSK